jgi:hypothetical protein
MVRRGTCVSKNEVCDAGWTFRDRAWVGRRSAGNVLDCGLRREDAGVWRGGADEQFGGGGERAVGAGGSWRGGFAVRDESTVWAARERRFWFWV